MIKNKIPCFHLLIYKLFKEKSQGRLFINYDCVREIVRRRFPRVSRQLHYVFLKEMEEFKLIKKNGNTRNITYELIGKNVDKILNKFKFPL